MKIQNTKLDINYATTTTTKTGRKSLLYPSTEIWKEKRHIFNGDYVGWRESGYHMLVITVFHFLNRKSIFTCVETIRAIISLLKSPRVLISLESVSLLCDGWRQGRQWVLAQCFTLRVALASFFPLGCLLWVTVTHKVKYNRDQMANPTAILEQTENAETFSLYSTGCHKKRIK